MVPSFREGGSRQAGRQGVASGGSESDGSALLRVTSFRVDVPSDGRGDVPDVINGDRLPLARDRGAEAHLDVEISGSDVQ